MGHVTVAKEQVRIDELEELYRLEASDSEPGGMPHDPEPEVTPAAEPGGMPHDPEPEGMPHD